MNQQQQQNKPKIKREFGFDILYFLAALFAELIKPQLNERSRT